MTWFEATAYCDWLSAARSYLWTSGATIQTSTNFGDEMNINKDYLNLTGYRLLTEAEWEFACREGRKTRYYFGCDETVLGDYARYSGNSQRHVWPVAGLKPNGLGLFDMHGNVCQWCESQPGVPGRPARRSSQTTAKAERVYETPA